MKNSKREKRDRKKIAPVFSIGAKQLPSIDDELQKIEESQFRWRIMPEYLDFNHRNFGWKKLTPQEILKEIIPKLHAYESLTWVEASRRKHFHPCKTEALSSLLKTLAESKGYDSLYQIDIGEAARIFGVKHAGIFYCIWYDALHNGKRMS